MFASPSLPDLQIPADTACGEAKHSLPPSGGHSAVSQPILDADKQTYQHDLSQSSRIKTDMNQTKTSNNEFTEREREIFGDTSTLDLDRCDVTEDPVIECLDNVLVINKHLCNVKQGAESQLGIKQGSESVGWQGKQGAELIFNTKPGGDSMADSVTGKSEADSLSQVIYYLI